jgi:hypothetical protein
MIGKTLRRVVMTAVLSVGALGSMSFAQPYGYHYYGPRYERREYREFERREAFRRFEWREHHYWRDGRWWWR